MNPTGGPSGGFNGPKPGVPGQGILGRRGAGEARQPVQAGRHDSPPRIDIPAIVTGSEGYIQNIRVPGMLHGRVVRPRGQTVYGLRSPDRLGRREARSSTFPDVRVVRNGDFLGVVAPRSTPRSRRPRS